MFFGPLKTGPLGGLRTRATLLSPVETSDEIGGVARTFTALATVWCRLEPILGDERFDQGRVEEAVAYRVAMRWHADVAASMRLSVGTRMLNIIASADPDGRRRRLIMLAEEIKS